MTLESIRRAVDYTRNVQPGVSIEVISARFEDEPLPADWLSDAPVTRSVLEVADLAPPRRLPLLADVLNGLGDPSEHDIAIFSNIDIAVQPFFYELIASTYSAGTDGFVINRRTVHPAFGATSIAALQSQVGVAHPGHDCFVFASTVRSAFTVFDVCLGAPHVGRALFWNLELNSRRFREFIDLHATFHLGDDRPWRSGRFMSYAAHNRQHALNTCAALIDRHGRDRVLALPHSGPYVAALEGGRLPRLPSSGGRVGRERGSVNTPPRSASRQRLVFAAQPGGCGAKELAVFLAQSSDAFVDHEAHPAFDGPLLRRSVHRGLGATYRQRQLKVEQLRSRLAASPQETVYVDLTHTFIMTMADVVLDAFNHDQISVLRLERPPAELLRIFLERGWFSSRTQSWPDWFHVPLSDSCLFQLPAEGRLDEADLILGYLADFEARTRAILAAAPAVQVACTQSAALRTSTGPYQLLDELQIGARPTTAQGVQTRSSALDSNAALARSIDPSWCTRRVAMFRERFSERFERAELDDLWAHST
ncbi:MAG: hypothetical protein WD225_09415 [Ilumatobacteraceae bacterium]